MSSASWAWLNLLKDVMEKGQESKPRDMRIKEILGYQATLDMEYPVISVIERKLQRKFLAGEAYWILTGDNRVSTISPYNSVIAKFSDDGRYFNGAYGPEVVDQLTYVVDSLVKDHDSRQAVMTIWRKNPRPSKDIPCTVAIQWFLRKRVDGAGIEVDEIHCIDTMRSSDAWLGWTYDVFNFTMLTTLIALMYKERTDTTLTLGKLRMQCGSQHIYENNWEAVTRILYGQPQDPRELGSVPCIPYAPLSIRDFDGPDHLMSHLDMVREGTIWDKNTSKANFMHEFMPKEK
jgi:thymidylate synthase